MSKRLFQWSLVVLALVAYDAWSQAALTDKLPVAPEVKMGKLANGLTYYIRKNSRPEQKVELRLAVKAGSILEQDDQRGLAHFTEHMAFNGTKHFKKNELVSFLQSIGVQFGADLNATTGFDETIYILPIPVDKPDNLEQGFLVLEDWASGVLFEADEIEKERGVVLEEERLGKGADERIMKETLPHILQGSRYADRLPIGTTESLKTFKPEALKRFYADWYRPDLMSVVVVGDIDAAVAESLVRKHFEKLKNPPAPRPREYAAVPPRTKSAGLVVTDPESTNHVLQIFYATRKSKVEATVGDYRDGIVKGLSGQMLGLRMQELTQKASPPFVFGGSERGGFVHGHESYFGFALVGKAGVPAAVDAVIQENERARMFGFTQAELERSKKSFSRNWERAYNERDKSESADYAEEYLRNFLNEESIPGIVNEYQYFKQFIDGISLQEVNDFTARNIPSSEENKLVVFQGPEKAEFEIPGNEELLLWVLKAEKNPVIQYEEKAVAKSLMETVPAGGKITAEKKNDALGTTELTLGNGVKVVLKPTDFKNDQVVMGGYRMGGQSRFENKDALNAQFASTVVSQMGVGTFTPTDLRKVLSGKTASASPRLTTLSEGFSGQSGTADVESMLQLVNLYFTKPRRDEELFKGFVSRQQAMLKNVLSDPGTVFQDSIQRMLYKDHPRGPRFPSEADLGKINLDRALEIYTSRFGTAGGWSFYLVGSFDLEKTKSLAATYLGSLPAGKAVAGFKDLGVRPLKGVVKKVVKKGKEAQSLISIAFTGEAPFSEDDQLVLQALLDVLNIKLIETLREELSSIYGGGVNGTLSKNPYNSYNITINLPCGPENVEKIILATFDEIQKVKDAGPSEADLNKVKETFSKKYLENTKDNSYWLSRLQRCDELGIEPAGILTLDKRMSAMTAKDLQAAARKYFNMNNYFQAVLYPD